MSSFFGVSITDETLKQMSRYRNRTITQEDRAREAMRLIHAEDKNINALQHALHLKKSYRNGASALVLVYNATGDVLQMVDNKDWRGDVYHEEPPRSFQNGQWISFLHCSIRGSDAARVYRGKDIEGQVRDYMVAWSVPWDSDPNRAYTEVGEKDHFNDRWADIKGLLNSAGRNVRHETDKHCTSTVSIGGYTTSECIVVLTHKFGELPGP